VIPLVALALIIYFDQRNPGIEFTVEDNDEEVPYTAFFHYDIKGVRDSVFIDFGNYERYHLVPEREMITQFYRSAGTPTVKVYTREKKLASLKLHNILS